MPFDPRMLQMAQMGIGMMGPQPGGQRPKQWWEQPLPRGQMGQSADPSKPDDPNNPAASKPQPGLLDMMMKHGMTPAVQYGKAQGGMAPAVQYGEASNPWSWLSNMWGPGGGR